MSGWIKIEKDLTDSIRFRRLVKAYRNVSRTVTDHNVTRDETLLFGALVRLWIYADTHVRDDNTLAVTLDEINEVVGVDGFAQILPAEWLQVIDPNRVELPDFLQHNGTSARARKNAAKRQAAYRWRQQNEPRNASVTHSNARNDARPDQTISKKRVRGAHSAPPTTTVRAKRAPGTGTRLPDDFALTPDRRQVAATERLDPERTFAKFVDYWRAASGSKARKHDWDATWRNWCRSEVDRNRPRVNGAPTPLVPKPPPTPEQVSEAHAEAARKNREQVERVLPNLRVAP